MSELRNQVPVVLSTDLIMELLANGYTRFQDESTFKNESIEQFLLTNFPNIFNKGNVQGQIRIMFSKPPLKGKRTQKVERLVFQWGVTQEVVEEPIEEIPAEYSIKEEEEIDVVIQEEKSDILVEETSDNSEDFARRYSIQEDKSDVAIQEEETDSVLENMVEELSDGMEETSKELELTPWELMG